MKLDDTISDFAPIIIPTLCRFEHLKRCLSSLAQCTWANQTVIYIGLDYPLKKSHEEGYVRIKKYLSTSNIGGCFKELNVLYREVNYGAEKNLKDLVDLVGKQYDRWIVSEDDNVFSPNFLDYLNKGLVLFEKDPYVLAINGYCHFYPFKKDDNTFFRESATFSAWGYACWKEKVNNLKSITYKDFRMHLWNFSTFRKFVKYGRRRMAQFLSLCCKNNGDVIYMTDNILSVWMILNNLDVVVPTISLVRNCGIDSSGISFSDASARLRKLHHEQVISKNVDFEFKGSGFEYYYDNIQIYKKMITIKFHFIS